MDLTTVEVNGKSYYLVDDEHYERVTTPLGIISSNFLEQWRGRVGKVKASRIGKKAASKGTTIHSLCDKICQGIEPDIKPRYKEDMDAFKEWFDKEVIEVVDTEKAVYSKTYLVAGRYDFIGRLRGLEGLCIVDWKTGRLKKEHFLQMEAYRRLTAECTNIPLEDIKHRKVVQIKEGKVKVANRAPNGLSVKTKYYNEEDIWNDIDWEVYLSALKIYRWMR